MAEDLVFRIRAMADGFDKATKTAAQELRRVGDAYADSTTKAQTMNASQLRLQNQYNAIGQAITKQEAKVRSLAMEQDALSKSWDEMVFGWQSADVGEPPQALQNAHKALVEAEQDLQRLKDKQIEVSTVVSSTSQSMNQKQQLQQTRMGVDSLAFAFQSMAYMGDQTITTLSQIASQIRFLKQGFRDSLATGSKFTAFLSAGLAGIAIAGNVVMSVIQSIKEKQEQAIQAAKEASDAYRDALGSREEMANAKRYLSILEDSKSSVKSINDAKDNLKQMFPDMIQGYTNEGSAILGTTKAMQAYIDTLEREAEVKREVAATGLPNLIEDLQKTIDQYMQDVTIGYNADEYENVTATFHQKAFDLIQQIKTDFSAMLSGMFGSDIASAMSGDIQKMWNAIYDEIVKNGGSGFDAEGLKKLYSTKIFNINLFKSAIERFGKDARKELVEALLTIPMGETHQLGEGFATNIVQKAFEIDQKVVTKPADEIASSFKDALIASMAKMNFDTSEAASMIDNILQYFKVDDQVQALVKSGDTAALANYIQTTLQAAAKAAGVTGPEALNQINSWVGPIIAALNFMSQFSGSGAQIKVPTAVRSGGGGSSTNKALQKQLDLLEHKKALDQLTAQEELAQLEQISRKYAKTTAEKQDLEEKIYALKKKMREDELNYQKDMDQLTIREEIAAKEALMNEYKMGTEERKDLEVEVYNLKKDLRKQEYDLAVYYGKLTLDQQATELEAMIAQYKEGTDARIDLEKELYDIQKTMLDRVVGGVLEALKNRYEEQRNLEKENVEASIKQWQDWEEAQTSAVQAQIDALDALTEAEDRQKEMGEKQRKVDSLQQQLQYENDEYNRKQLQDQLAAAQQELTDYQTKIQREDEKKSLEDRLKAIQDEAAAHEDQLNAQLDSIDKFYDDLESAAKLNAEAEKILMQSTQDQIIALLKQYAPDYNLTGQTLAEQMMNGFMAGLANTGTSIDTWFGSILASITSYQDQLAAAANAAADAYWANRAPAIANANAGTAQANALSGSNPVQLIVNFNQPIDKPSDAANALKDLLESMHLSN